MTLAVGLAASTPHLMSFTTNRADTGMTRGLPARSPAKWASCGGSPASSVGGDFCRACRRFSRKDWLTRHNKCRNRAPTVITPIVNSARFWSKTERFGRRQRSLFDQGCDLAILVPEAELRTAARFEANDCALMNRRSPRLSSSPRQSFDIPDFTIEIRAVLLTTLSARYCYIRRGCTGAYPARQTASGPAYWRKKNRPCYAATIFDMCATRPAVCRAMKQTMVLSFSMKRPACCEKLPAEETSFCSPHMLPFRCVACCTSLSANFHLLLRRTAATCV